MFSFGRFWVSSSRFTTWPFTFIRNTYQKTFYLWNQIFLSSLGCHLQLDCSSSVSSITRDSHAKKKPHKVYRSIGTPFSTDFYTRRWELSFLSTNRSVAIFAPGRLNFSWPRASEEPQYFDCSAPTVSFSIIRYISKIILEFVPFINNSNLIGIPTGSEVKAHFLKYFTFL